MYKNKCCCRHCWPGTEIEISWFPLSHHLGGFECKSWVCAQRPAVQLTSSSVSFNFSCFLQLRVGFCSTCAHSNPSLGQQLGCSHPGGGKLHNSQGAILGPKVKEGPSSSSRSHHEHPAIGAKAKCCHFPGSVWLLGHIGTRGWHQIPPGSCQTPSHPSDQRVGPVVWGSRRSGLLGRALPGGQILLPPGAAIGAAGLPIIVTCWGTTHSPWWRQPPLVWHMYCKAQNVGRARPENEFLQTTLRNVQGQKMNRPAGRTCCPNLCCCLLFQVTFRHVGRQIFTLWWWCIGEGGR